MKDYITTKDAAERWGITQRQVQSHCKKNHIPGVVRVGTNYLIPDNAKRPIYGYYIAPDRNDVEISNKTDNHI